MWLGWIAIWKYDFGWDFGECAPSLCKNIENSTLFNLNFKVLIATVEKTSNKKKI